MPSYYRMYYGTAQVLDLVEVDDGGEPTRQVLREISHGFEVVEAVRVSEFFDAMESGQEALTEFIDTYGAPAEGFEVDSGALPLSAETFEWEWNRARRDIAEALAADGLASGVHRLSRSRILSARREAG